MTRNTIMRWLRVVALGATVPAAVASVAWGQSGRYDNDDYYSRADEAREHGFKNGYRDGLNKGQYDNERGHRFNFKNDDWEDSRGFERWMGSKGSYKQAYRNGYESGYRRAYGDRYRDRDDYRRHDRDDWR